jgi:hypothetical protein
VIFLPEAYKLDGVIFSTILGFLLIQIPWESHVVFTSFFGRAESRAYWRAYAGYAAFALVTCVAAWSAARQVPLGGVTGLLAKGLVAALVSSCATLVLFRRDVKAVFDVLRNSRHRA